MMSIPLNRRQFLTAFAASLLVAPASATARSQPDRTPVKPPPLRVGDTIALVSPASFVEVEDVLAIRQTLTRLGLRVKLGRHALDRNGYLAGSDRDRANDLNAAFVDPDVRAILAMRGGWGCNRILPQLDYDRIRAHPKVFMGYSDITSLLLAFYSRAGLVSFHGLTGISRWEPSSIQAFQRVCFAGERVVWQNPPTSPIRTLNGDRARGRLVGGNLSVLAAMVGSGYLPDWRGKILFVEEIGEEVYRIDRLLTQLQLAGILERLQGFIFGQCLNCQPEEPDKSLSLMEVLRDRIEPLGIPAWYGAEIGHIRNQFILPVGIEVEIDADRGTIQLLESPVGDGAQAGFPSQS